MKFGRRTLSAIITLSILVLALVSCGQGSSAKPLLTSSQGAVEAPIVPGSSQGSTGSLRDPTPQVLVPTASGEDVYEDDDVIIDYSNVSQGYIMVKYTAELREGGRIKIEVIPNDYVKENEYQPDEYYYDIVPSEEFTTIPITLGDGNYTVNVRSLKAGTTNDYAYDGQLVLDVELESEFIPFLYPSLSVYFDENSLSVSTAEDVVTGATSDLDAIESIFNFVVDNVEYDWDLAASDRSFYYVDADSVVQTGTGTCYEYSTLMAAMLRSQGFPTKMVFGFAGDAYHAWLLVYEEESGTVDRVIHFNGNSWQLMDPTFASSGNRGAEYEQYIGDGANYINFSYY